MKTSLLRLTRTILVSSCFAGFASLAIANTELDETVVNSGLSGSFLASRLAISDQDDAAAVRFLQRAIGLDKDNVRLQQDYLASLVANGRIEEAAKLLKGLGELDAGRSLRAFVQATVDIKKRSWKEIANTLEDTGAGDLDKTMREITEAWALAGERKVDEALEMLSEDDGPEWVRVMRDYHAGLIADTNGRSDLAAEKYQAVIDQRAVIGILTETYVRAVEARVRNRSLAGDAEGARQTLDYGLSLLPDHGPFKQTNSKLANDEVLKLMIASPQAGVAELFYNIASALRRDDTGDFSKSYLQLAHFLEPDSDVIKIGLAELYLRQGNYVRSNEFYDQIEETSPFSRISRLEKASNLSRLERKEEAIKELQALIEAEPGDLTGYMVLGGLFNREKRYREAADVYDKAVDIIGTPQTHHWNLFFRRGIAYERLKEWPKAEPNFEKSLELSANQAEVLNYLGYSWIDQGINLDEGMEMIRKAVELRPRSGFIVDSLGWAYYRIGEYENAVRELERAVSLMPNDPTINDHLGDAYWKVGRKLEATFQWKIALASKDEPEDPEKIKKKLAEGLLDAKKDEAKAE